MRKSSAPRGHAGPDHPSAGQPRDSLLREAGAQLSDVVRLNIYTTDVDRYFEAFDAAAGRSAETGCRPASTLLGVTRLAFPELLVEIEAMAVV